MSDVSAVQKQSLADVLQNRCQAYSFKEETPTQVFSYEIYEIFKNTFFYKNTSTLVAAFGSKQCKPMKIYTENLCCRDKCF